MIAKSAQTALAQARSAQARSAQATSAQAAKVPLTKVPSHSIFLNPLSLGVESVERYAALVMKNIRTHLVKEANLRNNPAMERKVMLILTPLAGFGDILFIYKATQALKNERFIVSITITPVDEVNPLKVKAHLMEMTGMHDVEILTSCDGIGDVKPDCIIMAPTIPEDEIIDRVMEPLSIPYGVIFEYGGNRTDEQVYDPFLNYELITDENGVLLDIEIETSFAPKSGIAPDELGIFTEGGLIKPLSKEQKSEKLDILKKNYPKEMNLIYEGKSGKDYLDSTNLYFGYAHKRKSMQRFVSTIAYLESSKKSNIDIVIPWRAENTTRSEFNQKCIYDKDQLKEAGISRVEVVTSNGINSEILSEDGALKILRIFNIFPVPNALIRDLLCVSQAPVLVTGDQSFNEAMLLSDKIILYEEMDWKIDFQISMLKMSKPYPLMTNLMQLWNKNMPEDCKNIATAILALEINSSEQGSESQVELYHESIINKDNSLERYICQEALRLSEIGRNDVFARETQRIENNIKEIFNLYFDIIDYQKIILYFLQFNSPEIDSDRIKIYHLFMENYEIDRAKISEEIINLLTKGINMVDKMLKQGEFNQIEQLKVSTLLKKIPILLFPLIEKQLETIRI